MMSIIFAKKMDGKGLAITKKILMNGQMVKMGTPAGMGGEQK